MWQGLFSNLAIVALILVAWQIMMEQIKPAKFRFEGVGVGILLGAAGVLAMAMNIKIGEFYFDLRATMVACAAFFGGPIGAMVAAVLMGSFRVYLGGAGAFAGVIGILVCAGVGLMIRQMAPRFRNSGMMMFVFAAVNSAATLAGFFFLPAEKILPLLTAAGPTLSAMVFVSTLCVGGLLLWEKRRHELIETNAMYRQMVDSLPDPLHVIDRDGKFIAANPATYRLFHLPRDAYVGDIEYTKVLPADIAQRCLDADKLTRETGMVSVEDHIFMREDGKRQWFSVRKMPMVDRNGEVTGVITNKRDVSEHHHLIEMKSEFVSLVSHELRTPLTSVRGALGMLDKLATDSFPDNARNLITIAHRNSIRLVQLINDILDVEKIEDGSLEFELSPAPLAPVISDAIPMFEKYMPEQNVRIVFDNQATDIQAEIDPGRFEQVLSNLVSNAIKFSRKNGEVIISLERSEDTAVISVRDSGSGIPKAFQNRVFRRFEQGDSSDNRIKGGTGLGLHIAKVFVETMGGHIRFLSEENVGTVFFIELPLVEAPQGEKLAPKIKPVATARREGCRILYVEDDTSLGAILSELLSKDAIVDQVTSLAAAHKAIEEYQYDLFLVDDDLPDGSGLSLLNHDPNTPPAIVFTAREVNKPLPGHVVGRFIKTKVDEREIVHTIRNTLQLRAAA